MSKVFQRAEPQPYSGHAKFRRKVGDQFIEEDVTGKPVVVVDHPAHPEMKSLAAAVWSAQIQNASDVDDHMPWWGIALIGSVVVGLIIILGGIVWRAFA